jgi:hypothetical protein
VSLIQTFKSWRHFSFHRDVTCNPSCPAVYTFLCQSSLTQEILSHIRNYGESAEAGHLYLTRQATRPHPEATTVERTVRRRRNRPKVARDEDAPATSNIYSVFPHIASRTKDYEQITHVLDGQPLGQGAQGPGQPVVQPEKVRGRRQLLHQGDRKSRFFVHDYFIACIHFFLFHHRSKTPTSPRTLPTGRYATSR